MTRGKKELKGRKEERKKEDAKENEDKIKEAEYEKGNKKWTK